MAKGYSQDLRDRVIDAVELEGMSRRQAAKRFGMSESAAIKWLQRVRDTGVRTALGKGGHRRPVIEPHRDFVEAALTDKPDITLQALCDGILDAGILLVYEGRWRPPEMAVAKWLDHQTGKVTRALGALEADPPALTEIGRAHV